MARKRVAMSNWEVAEMCRERMSGRSWEQIGRDHGISCHKAKREVRRFCDLARERGIACRSIA